MLSLAHTELLISLYRTIRTIRRFEETGVEKYHEGRIHGYFHPYIGEEAIAAGACSALGPDDYIVSTHRGHGHCIARGADIRLMMAELYGKATGYSRGRGGSMHISDQVAGNIGANGIVGGGIPLAVGVGMGIRQEGSSRVVVCFFGDGASNNGVFGESLNLAAIYSLPVVFVLENNCYAATTHVSETARCIRLSERAAGYGLPASFVFGNDPLEVRRAVSEAVERARPGDGPTLIEAETYRMFGHHVRDRGSYMPPGDLAHWKTLDPLLITRRRLEETGIPEEDIAEIDREIEEELRCAVAFAESSPEPDPEEFLRDVLAYYDPR
jgi:TPP-dependent pyruvate/acetoin dehydrogenase alpha subunit